MLRANNPKFEGFVRPTGPDLAAGLVEQYLTVVLIQEQASVARLVGYILARTLLGEAEVETSFSDLQLTLNLSRSAVSEGLQRALAAGYIRQLQQGENGHIKSVYALVWAEGEADLPTPPHHHYRSQAGRLSQPGATSLDQTLESDSEPEEVLPFGADAIENLCQTTSLRDISSYQSYQPTGSDSLEVSNIESVELESVELESNVTAPSRPVAKSDRPALPTYLANLGHDLSTELGDLAHLKSNHTQIANLFRTSGLDEKEFARLMYQSRDLTHRYAVLRPGEQMPPLGQKRNKMAYFFVVLRDKLAQFVQELRQGVSTSGETAKSAPTPVAPSRSQVAKPTTERKNRIPSLKVSPQPKPKSWSKLLQPNLTLAEGG